MADPTPAHPGRLLKERFLAPLGLTASDLAAAIHVPRSRISELIAGKRQISPDTALRLGRFFRTDPRVWLQFQADWDLAHTAAIPEIQAADLHGFVSGPAGITTQPQATRPSTADGTYSPALVQRLRAAAALTCPEPEVREHVHLTYPSGQQAWESRRR